MSEWFWFFFLKFWTELSVASCDPQFPMSRETENAAAVLLQYNAAGSKILKYSTTV